jgi:hypothetical protein
MNRLISLFIILVTNFYANSLTNISKIASYSEEISLSKQIVNITQKELSLQTKSENIQDLFSMALNESRIKNDEFKYISVYNNFERGDELLLKCLKETGCDIGKFADIMQKSELHQKIAYKYPQISIGKLNQLVGTLNENLMNRYFIYSGWTKIEGEVGRNGIDGLFIKRNKEGIVKEVLIVESKYNKSGLQDTNNGKQMTKQWIQKKIENLQKEYPNNEDYKQIEQFVSNDIYRAMLWNLKVEDEKLIFDLSKLNDKFGNIEKVDLIGGEKFKINQSNNSFIDINKPENEFQEKIIDWYNKEVNNINL